VGTWRKKQWVVSIILRKIVATNIATGLEEGLIFGWDQFICQGLGLVMQLSLK